MQVASVVIVAGVVLATPATTRAEEGGPTVTIHHYQYDPSSFAVPAGTTVTWTNEDEAAHDVATTSGPAAFQSAELAKGQSFTYTFTVAGTYQYLCTVHPDMVAAVSVTPESTTTASPTTTTTAPPGAPDVAADPGATTTSTSTSAPVIGVNAGGTEELSASPVPAASIRSDDLASSSRPYLVLLSAVAAVVVACLLLLGWPQ